MNKVFIPIDDYNFDLHKTRRNIYEDASPSLFSDEDLQRIKIESKEEAERFLDIFEAEITKKQIDDIKKEMCRLKFDLEYFIKAYTWVEEDIINRANTTYTNRLFYLFNNIAYQLREFTGCLLSYSDKCYLSIYNDLKEEIISAYNEEISENLETLFRLDQDSKTHLKDRADWIRLVGYHLEEIINNDTLNVILRCLSNHPSKEIRTEFEKFDEKRFYEQAVFSPLAVLCFNELFSYANDVKEAIKKIEQPKNAYRTIKECEYLYDVLYERFQTRHPEYTIEAEEALKHYLSDYHLEHNVQNIIKRKETVIHDLKDTTLGKIWDEYHHDKSKLVENIVNAEASRADFDEYFRYIIKIEYLSECANNIINPTEMQESIDSPTPADTIFQSLVFFNEKLFFSDERKRELRDALRAAIGQDLTQKNEWYAVLCAAQSVEKTHNRLGYKFSILAEKKLSVPAFFVDLDMLLPELKNNPDVFVIDDNTAATPSARFKRMRDAIDKEKERWTIKNEQGTEKVLEVQEWERTEYIPNRQETLSGKRINNREEKYQNMLKIAKRTMNELKRLLDRYVNQS